MAIRWIGVGGNRFKRTTGIPSIDSWSASLWFRITTLTSGGSDLNTLIRLGDSTGGTFYDLCESGSKLKIYNGSHNAGTSTIVVNTWYHAAMTSANVTGANILMSFLNGGIESNFTSATSFTPNNFTVGDSETNDPLSGDIAALKIWNVPLTIGEIQNEMLYYMPKRAEGLTGVFPFINAGAEALVDISGKGFDWTAQGTAPAAIDGPPINWAPRRRSIVYVPTGGGGTSVNLIIPAGALVLAGFAPTWSTSDNKTVVPPAGALVLGGFKPTVETPRAMVPPAGALVLGGFAPTIETPRALVPPAGALVFGGFAPKVESTTDVRTPPAGALVLGGFAPTVQTSNAITVIPPPGAVVLGGFAPTVETPRSLVPPAGALVFGGFAPTRDITTAVRTPPAGALAFGGFAPTIQIGNQISLIPGAGSVVLGGFAPTVLASNNRTITPPAGALTLQGYAPSIAGTLLIMPLPGGLHFQGFRPTIFAINANTLVRYRDVRMQPFWLAVRKRLSSVRMIEILGKPGRVYVPTMPIPDRENERRDQPWTRIIVQQVQGLSTLRPDLPGQPRLVPFMVKVETVDFQAVGYDIQIPLDAAHAEVFELLDNWAPGIVESNGVQTLVSMPVYRQYPPDTTPLLDDSLSVWARSAEYRTQLAPVP